MVQELELDIEKTKGPEDILTIFKSQKIEEPWKINLVCLYHNRINEIQQFTFLTYLQAAFRVLSKEIEEKEMDIFIAHSIRNVFSSRFTLFQFENSIEHHWKTHIIWKDQHKESNEDNPLEGLFGLWKDTNITLEQIREKAWRRKI